MLFHHIFIYVLNIRIFSSKKQKVILSKNLYMWILISTEFKNFQYFLICVCILTWLDYCTLKLYKRVMKIIQKCDYFCYYLLNTIQCVKTYVSYSTGVILEFYSGNNICLQIIFVSIFTTIDIKVNSVKWIKICQISIELIVKSTACKHALTHIYIFSSVLILISMSVLPFIRSQKSTNLSLFADNWTKFL